MSDTVQRIKDRLSIVEVVSSYVELKKAGKSYKGKSPFTNEKTPSFFVSPDRGAYYCFSSQKGGDIFTFIEEMEGVDFKGALKILAERAGVEIEKEDPVKRSERDTLYAVLDEATKFFFKEREEQDAVNTYLRDRGVLGETIHAWRIGYAKDEWRSLRSHLLSRNFTDADMQRAGLTKRADGGKEPYDVFRNRIMFPLTDASGRVVGFSGRTLSSEAHTPKYVNSPETAVYKKSEILFGYDKARQGIRQYDFSLIVEGQFDVVLSHQAGYTNTVAVSGTALTGHHILLLSRLSSRVVLALDADRAGIIAVRRAGELMLRRGMDVKVAEMVGGKDPADMVKADKNEYKRVVGGSRHIIEFLLQVLQRSSKDARTLKLRVREELLPLLSHVESRIDREHFEGVIAERTGSTAEAIHYEVERIVTLSQEKDGTRVSTSPGLTSARTTPRILSLIAYLLAFVVLLRSRGDALAGAVEAVLKPLLVRGNAEGRSVSDAEVNKFLFTLEETGASWDEARIREEAVQSLTELRQLLIREELACIRSVMKEAEVLGDETLLSSSLEKVRALQLERDVTIVL